MIKASKLTRRFGRTEALKSVSFEIDRGEVVAVLGPNGAGKTTLMRLLACLLPPTDGLAEVGGLDVYTHSVGVRKLLGYLPESVAIYPEMRVSEYLKYRARLKGVRGRALRTRLERVAEDCGIKDSMRLLAGTLSQGFRRRVGLAEALISDPEVLILDEPTMGLDPAQRQAVLEIIGGLTGKRTVLLSSHSLSGLEKICTRVLFFYEGRLVMSDTPAGLLDGGGKSCCIVVEVLDSSDDIEERIGATAGVCDVQSMKIGEWRRIRCICDQPDEAKENIYRLSVQNRWLIRELRSEQISLESAFLRTTRKQEVGGYSSEASVAAGGLSP